MCLDLDQEVLVVKEVGNFLAKNTAANRWLGIPEMICAKPKQTNNFSLAVGKERCCTYGTWQYKKTID